MRTFFTCRRSNRLSVVRYADDGKIKYEVFSKISQKSIFETISYEGQEYEWRSASYQTVSYIFLIKYRATCTMFCVRCDDLVGIMQREICTCCIQIRFMSVNILGLYRNLISHKTNLIFVAVYRFHHLHV